MRLVCPNCDAEYEVDASVIPDGGRDVQCSNCGHAWFQISPELEAAIAAEEALYEPPPPVERPVPASASASASAAMPQRQLDESVLAVLKEEAEREVEARRAEAPRMEMQTDMALEAPAKDASGLGAVAQRLARMKGAETARMVKPQTRADVFPEIEEINSTLRASSEKRSGAADATAATASPQTQASGFGSGFVLMLVLAVLLVTVYVMAPKIAQQIPAASAALTGFVQAVDLARLQLDQLLQSAIAFLNGLKTAV